MKLWSRLGMAAGICTLAVLLGRPGGHPAEAGTIQWHTFDLVVHTQPAWVPADGTLVEGFVGGQPCGYGWIDAAGTDTFFGLYSVPATCAYPGAPVYFLVNGYVLNSPGAWGVDPKFSDRTGYYSVLETSLAPRPGARWGGSVFGVPPGASVEARIGGVVCGTTTTTPDGGSGRVNSSLYQIQVVPASPPPYGIAYCGFPGMQVDFYVNGVKAAQHPSWSPGAHQMTLSQP